MTSVTSDSVEKITSPLSIHDIINKVVVVSCCYNIGIFYPANFSDECKIQRRIQPKKIILEHVRLRRTDSRCS